MRTHLFASILCAAPLVAQETQPTKPQQGAKLAVPSVPGAKPVAAKPKKAGGPTVITSRDASFRSASQTAEFKFEVTVDGPSFKISCDHLKIILKPKPTVKPVEEGDVPKPEPGDEKKEEKEADGGALGGNIEEAIATGNVIITQDKPGKPGEPPIRYLVKGKRAVFNNVKGSLTVTGWPQVIESIDGKPTKQTNALEEGTKVILFQSNDMDIEGRSEVIIHAK